MSIRKPVTPQIHAEIIQLYTIDCMNMERIAERYSFSRKIVERELRQAGIQIRKPGGDVRPKRSVVWQHVEEIIKRYVDERQSLRTIANYFSVSFRPVMDVLQSEGIAIRSPKEARYARTDKYACCQTKRTLEVEVKRLRKQNEPIQDIASRVGISAVEVYEILQKSDVLVSAPKPKWEK